MQDTYTTTSTWTGHHKTFGWAACGYGLDIAAMEPWCCSLQTFIVLLRQCAVKKISKNGARQHAHSMTSNGTSLYTMRYCNLHLGLCSN